MTKIINQRYIYKVINYDRGELIITFIATSRRYLFFGKRVTKERSFRGSLDSWGELPHGWEVEQCNIKPLNQIWRTWSWTKKDTIENKEGSDA